MRSGRVAIAALLVASCAHPPARLGGPVLTLYIRDNLADSARLCVPQRAYSSGPFMCVTVGEIRRALRGITPTSARP